MKRKGIIKKYKLTTETPTYCRNQAKTLMRQLHPELDWHFYCVHHIDHNPCNNNLNNLQIMNRSAHGSLHNKGVLKPRLKKVISSPKIITEQPYKIMVREGNQTDVFEFGKRWRKWWIITKVKYNHKLDHTEIKLRRI